MNQAQAIALPQSLQKSILIVDDHIANLQMLSKLFLEQDYKVRMAANGKQALMSVRQNPPDLILLDILMPKIDGYEVCSQLKASVETKDIPIIFISALHEVFDKVKAFEVGGVDYITKPFQKPEILARVTHQLRIKQLNEQLTQKNLRLSQEIEQRQLAEAMLHQRYQEFMALVENSPDVVARLDREFRYLYINPAVEKAVGIPAEEFIGKNLRELGFPEATVSVKEQGTQFVFTTGKEQTIEFSMPSPEGIKFYQMHLIPETDSHGDVKSVLAISRDITELKNLAEREQKKAQELEQTLAKLQQTQSQLIQAEKMSSLGQMVAGVAHEINNPLSFIYGNIFPATKYTKDLLDILNLYQHCSSEVGIEINQQIKDVDIGFIAEDFPKLLGSMKEGAERIHQIVKSLQNFSRFDEQQRSCVDIHEGIDNTLLILQYRLKQQPHRPLIQVTKEYGELPKINCYPAQMNQVFLNILSNAIDAIDEVQDAAPDYQPQIWICTEVIEEKEINPGNNQANHNQVFIRIANNGVPISPEVKQKIFDPFFTTKSVGNGTGLGLSISYQIVVERHEGEIFCDSLPCGGTEFAIALPI
jgi:PAS domain S-box-containing protein